MSQKIQCQLHIYIYIQYTYIRYIISHKLIVFPTKTKLQKVHPPQKKTNEHDDWLENPPWNEEMYFLLKIVFFPNIMLVFRVKTWPPTSPGAVDPRNATATVFVRMGMTHFTLAAISTWFPYLLKLGWAQNDENKFQKILYHPKWWFGGNLTWYNP